MDRHDKGCAVGRRSVSAARAGQRSRTANAATSERIADDVPVVWIDISGSCNGKHHAGVLPSSIRVPHRA